MHRAQLELVIGGYLIAYAVLPSLVGSSEAPASVLGWRRVLLPTGLLALALTLVALAQALITAVALLGQLYPRFLI